jgi:hypothetical protein
VLRGRAFIRLPPAVARRRTIQWASGLTYLSADLIAPVALWEVPTVKSPDDGCLQPQNVVRRRKVKIIVLMTEQIVYKSYINATGCLNTILHDNILTDFICILFQLFQGTCFM